MVLHDIRKRRDGYCYYIADPASQLVTYTETEMRKCWLVTKKDGKEKGAALALEPSPQFYEEKDEADQQQGKGLLFFAKYLFPYRKEFIQLLLGMLVGTLLQLVFPFLTQSLVTARRKSSSANRVCWKGCSNIERPHKLRITTISCFSARNIVCLHINIHQQAVY